MRYEDWDILIFPRDLTIPVKEFKVACQVVPDVEFAHIHGSFGLPTMTCFIPTIPAGTPFNISIHSWKSPPDISQFTTSYSKHPELVKFEARVLIDGKFVASTNFDRTGNWPHLLSHSFEFTKNGELEPLRFPTFRRELLHESLWSPADEIGRIKLIISEGFPRDSLSMPIERVKNVVSFSFQHAPLQILEDASIAWPNPVMWRRAPLNNAMQVPSYPSEEGAESHAHSPRRRTQASRTATTQVLPATHAPGMPSYSSSTRHSARAGRQTATVTTPPDPFTEPDACYEWMANIGLQDMSRNTFGIGFRSTSKASSSDSSMPDYISSHHSGRASVCFPDHTFPHLFGRNANLHLDDGALKVPTNTPIAGPGDGTVFGAGYSSAFNPAMASSLTNSLLCQPLPLPIHPHNIPLPASEVRSRKENRQMQLGDESPLGTITGTQITTGQLQPGLLASDHIETRKVSRPLFDMIGSGLSMGTVPTDTSAAQRTAVASSDPSVSTVGASRSGSLSLEQSGKILRNFTPASARLTDDESQPRGVSPRVLASNAADGVHT